MENWSDKIASQFNTYKNTVYDNLFFSYVGLYALACFIILQFNLSLHGDEYHFYPTIITFASQPFWETLYHYNELTTPLAFIIYAAFGKLTNLDINTLRTASIIISAFTLLSIYLLFKNYSTHRYVAFFLSILFSLNPYFMGLSIYVYTDMLTLLCCVWMLLFLRKNNALGYTFMATAALLCRQHTAIIIASYLGVLLIHFFYFRKKEALPFIIGSLFSFIILSILFFYWKNITPNGPMTQKLNTLPFQYELSAISTYLFSIGVYTFPLFFLYSNKIKKIVPLKWLLIPSFIYFLFPIQAALCSINDGVFTVGLFHKLVTTTIANDLISNGILYFFFYLGLCLVGFFILKIKKNPFTSTLPLLMVSIVAFSIIMPFSFQIWEKYILIILPQCFILLADTSE